MTSDKINSQSIILKEFFIEEILALYESPHYHSYIL